MEPLIRALYGLSESSSDDHDAVDPITVQKYEIKCSKVLTSYAAAAKANLNLFDRICAEGPTMPLRAVAYKERYEASYGSNIQNVKREHFDFLIYVLLFSDCVCVFKVQKDKIKQPEIPNWSDKHGRYDQLGMSGQFNIDKSSIARHEKSYRLDTFTYTDLVPVCKSL